MSVVCQTKNSRTSSDAASELLKRRKARRNLIPFCRYTFPEYQEAAHLRILAGKLEAIERGELKRLIVLMPPRHGKSELISKRFPCWYLGKHPNDYVVEAGYAESIALTHSRQARDIFISTETSMVFPHIRYRPEKPGQEIIIPERQAAHEWGTKQGGSYYAVGIGGGLTGRGFNVGIIDDPVKDAEEADSPTYRDRAWDWYVKVFRTRAEPNAAIIVVMTRWHQDDLVGRLLEQARKDPGADQWEVLHFPAIQDGKALWPSRFPVSELLTIRADDARTFEALYQGNPTIAEGQIIKREWWKYFREAPGFNRKIQSWDTAFKDKTKNDFSVCTTWGETKTAYYLLHVWRGRVEFPELKRTAIALYDKHLPDLVLVEDMASGQSLIQELERNTRMPVYPVKVDKNKVARTNAVTPMIEAGRVFLPENAPWLFDYIEELSAFPNAAHDDQCFVAGTQVATLWGKKSIEKIHKGDFVITPTGVKKVIWSGKTGEKPTVNNMGLEGTAKHKVFTYDGWVSIDSLTQALRYDKLSYGGLIRWKYRKLLFLMASPSGAWAGRESIILASQILMKGGGILKDFMSQFGNFITTKKYQSVAKFTIKTATLLIMTSLIWSAYQSGNMLRHIQSKIEKSKPSILKESAHLPQNGIEQQKAGNGIKPMLSRRLADLLRSMFAYNVVESLNQKAKEVGWLNTAPLSAATNTAGHQDIMTLPLPVQSAGCLSKHRKNSIPPEQRKHAAAVVPDALATSSKTEVYNLTVDKDHVFYARGFLVSNCDSTTQALSFLRGPGLPTEQVVIYDAMQGVNLGL